MLDLEQYTIRASGCDPTSWPSALTTASSSLFILSTCPILKTSPAYKNPVALRRTCNVTRLRNLHTLEDKVGIMNFLGPQKRGNPKTPYSGQFNERFHLPLALEPAFYSDLSRRDIQLRHGQIHYFQIRGPHMRRLPPTPRDYPTKKEKRLGNI